MPKENIKIKKVMKSQWILLILMIVMSCNKQASFEPTIIGKIVLSYDSASSNLIDMKFRYDSLFVERIRKDSMTIIRYLGGEGYYCYSQFSLKDCVFYENRIVPQMIMEGETETSVFLIPTFLISDTIFSYTPFEDFTSFFVIDLGSDQCNYQIKKIDSAFITIKQSLIDTTYKEIYYYDRNYNIYKYVNTWKENKCVYVRAASNMPTMPPG